jgi:hypothetical protein
MEHDIEYYKSRVKNLETFKTLFFDTQSQISALKASLAEAEEKLASGNFSSSDENTESTPVQTVSNSDETKNNADNAELDNKNKEGTHPPDSDSTSASSDSDADTETKSKSDQLDENAFEINDERISSDVDIDDFDLVNIDLGDIDLGDLELDTDNLSFSDDDDQSDGESSDESDDSQKLSQSPEAYIAAINKLKGLLVQTRQELGDEVEKLRARLSEKSAKKDPFSSEQQITGTQKSEAGNPAKASSNEDDTPIDGHAEIDRLNGEVATLKKLLEANSDRKQKIDVLEKQLEATKDDQKKIEQLTLQLKHSAKENLEIEDLKIKLDDASKFKPELDKLRKEVLEIEHLKNNVEDLQKEIKDNKSLEESLNLKIEEIAAVVKFFKSSNECEKHQQLAQAAFVVLKKYELNGSIKFTTTKNGEFFASEGEIDGKDRAQLVKHANDEQMIENKNNIVFHFNTVSMLVREIPKRDKVKRNRIIDNLLSVVSGIDARVILLKKDSEVRAQKASFNNLIKISSESLNKINGTIKQLYQKNSAVMKQVKKNLMNE